MLEESGQASLRRCPGRLRRKQACEEPGTGRVLQSPASAKTPRRQGAGVKGQRFREKLQEIDQRNSVSLNFTLTTCSREAKTTVFFKFHNNGKFSFIETNRDVGTIW